MASVTHLVTTPDTGNTPNTSGAFTPTAGALLVVFATKEASTSADGGLTSSVGGFTFSQIRREQFRSGADSFYVFVSDSFVSNTGSQTVTIPTGDDSGGGTIISVYEITGLGHAGTLSVRQSGGLSDQASGVVPSVDFDTAAALTANCCIGAIGVNDGTPALTAPSGWSESQDTGYTTGQAQGIETVFRNSGHTSQTVAWQTATTGGVWAGIILEIQIGIVYEKAGAGQLDAHGSGVRYRDPITFEKAGKATMGIAAAEPAGIVKQNSAILVGAASGSDVKVSSEAGAGVLVRSGTAGDALVWVETGAGASARVGSGSETKTRIYEKQNSGIASFSGTASDALVWVEKGTGILSAVGSGPEVKSGAVSKQNSGIAGFSASALEATVAVESGAGILAASASGTITKGGTSIKAGSGISGFTAGGAEASTSVESGGGILAASASGIAVKGGGVTYEKSGLGRMGVEAGTGPQTYVKQNSGVLVLVGSGIAAKEGGKFGSGISARSGSGARAVVYVEADAGGADAPEPPALEADHPANIIFRGSGVAQKIGAAAKTGSGILSASASGVRAKSVAKSGSGVSGFSAAGSDVAVRAEAGAGILNASASGSKSIGGGTTYAKDGSGIRGFAASGTDAAIRVEMGAGSLPFVASGSRSATRVQTGKGILSFVGSGAKEALLGTTYQKSGAGMMSSTGGGVRQRMLIRAGSGILERSGSARDVVSWSKGGSGMATFTASGERSYGHVPGAVTIVEQVGVELTLQRGLGAAVSVSERKKASLTVA